MTMNNLSVWDKFSVTDQAMTKRVNQRGGYTAIDPTYQAKNATKAFGPYGRGWGLCVSDFDYTLIDKGVVVHKAVFFYVLEGERFEFPISNAIEAFKKTKAGDFFNDTDFAKKLETNTVSKALSKLGFNADVFMGYFEDEAYLNSAATELANEKTAENDAKQIEKMKEVVEYTKQSCLKIMESENKSLLNLLYKEHESVIKRKCNSVPVANEKYVTQLQQAYKEMLDKFENK